MTRPREVLRDCVLDAMREELLTKDWAAVTLADIAHSAGVSRQSIYNEFGSRQGLAQGYALRLADRLVDAVSARLRAILVTSTRRSCLVSDHSSLTRPPTRW